MPDPSPSTTACIAAALMMLAGRPALADPSAHPILVLHLQDYQQVASEELGEAQKILAETFRKSGVQLIWTTGYARTAPTDGLLHADVAMLNATLSQADGSHATVLGKANAEMRR